MDIIIQGIKTGEKVLIGGDLNNCICRYKDNHKRVQEGLWRGVTNGRGDRS